MSIDHLALHPDIVLVHLTDEVDVSLFHTTYVKIFQTPQKVLVLDLIPNFRPDLVQLRLIIPVHLR